MFFLDFEGWEPPDEFRKEAEKLVQEKLDVILKKRSKRSGKLWMITITKPQNVSFNTLKKFVETRIEKVWIPRYWYCYELQKSMNPHAHVLIDLDHKMQRNRVLKGFQRKGWNIKADAWDTVEKGKKYLLGHKRGGMKPMHEQDINFRKNNNLQDIYTYPNANYQAQEGAGSSDAAGAGSQDSSQ